MVVRDLRVLDPLVCVEVWCEEEGWQRAQVIAVRVEPRSDEVAPPV